MFFQTVKVQRQLGYDLLEISVCSLESVDLLAGGVSVRVPTQTLLGCLHELVGP